MPDAEARPMHCEAPWIEALPRCEASRPARHTQVSKDMRVPDRRLHRVRRMTVAPHDTGEHLR